VICGQGVNAAGIAPDGQTARLDALGEISGDWGGGTDVGWAGLAAAVRARDGRGPRTALEQDVPAHWGLKTPAAVTEAFYTGRIRYRQIGQLSPVVFGAAGAGDAEARKIVDRIADGKVEKFYQETVLTEQAFVKDPEKTVGQVVVERGGKDALDLRFVRFKLGEAAPRSEV